MRVLIVVFFLVSFVVLEHTGAMALSPIIKDFAATAWKHLEDEMKFHAGKVIYDLMKGHSPSGNPHLPPPNQCLCPSKLLLIKRYL